MSSVLVLPSELAWGLLTRGVGLVYLISFASLIGQIMTLGGRGGYRPLGEHLHALRRDFGWRRFLYFPTLSWLSPSETLLAAMPWLGLAAAGSVIVGGPYTRWAFVACYALYLSLDRVVILMFPWDSMLFEAGFWAMFLPPLHLLPDATALAAPDPALAWVYRLLLFRVLFGFGKFKFLGSTSQDTGYLRGFLINQPLVTPIGWIMQKLPMPLLKASLYLMFLVEIPLPFMVFAPRWSSFAALAIDLFMLVIWACGTFGYFSLIMIIVSLSWLDPATAQQLHFAGLFTFDSKLGLHLLVALHMFGALLSFPFNSYCSMTWMNWPVWRRIRPRILTAPIRLYRALHPLRWLHAYGVFPPRPSPPVKVAPVMELTWDGQTWHQLGHHYSPTHERSRPRFCSPHQARLDQSFIYESFGLTDASPLRNTMGWWEPYGYVQAGGSWDYMRRALEGYLPDLLIDHATLPAGVSGLPVAARMRTYLLTPTTVAELRATGHWWHKRLIGPHTGPLTRAEGFGEHAAPPPELWHFDDIEWLERSRMGRLMARARRGEDVHSLVLTDAEGLGPDDVTRFWDDFLPSVGPGRDGDWSGLRARVQALRQRYDRAQLYRFERLAGRYGSLMMARLEPLFLDRGLAPVFGRVHATLDAKTNYHLGLLTRHILCDGRAAYDAVLAEPKRANEALAQLTMRSGGYLLAIFRFEVFVFLAQKLRLLKLFLEVDGRQPPSEAEKKNAARIDAIVRRIIGPIDMLDFLREEFARPEDSLDVPEQWPRYTQLGDGSIVPLVEAPPAPANASKLA